MKRPKEELIIPYQGEVDLVLANKLIEWINYSKYLEQEIKELKAPLVTQYTGR